MRDIYSLTENKKNLSYFKNIMLINKLYKSMWFILADEPLCWSEITHR